MNLVNDAALVGFWPMNEPSGAPLFKNYSRSFGRRPSGISFDMQVHLTSSSAHDQEVADQSDWPGSIRIFNPSSGTFHEGFAVQGYSDLVIGTTAEGDGPYEKVLIMGHGSWENRRAFVGPPIAQSGFTVGMWVYPRSDGYIPFSVGLVTNQNHYENQGLAQHHALVSQHSGEDGFIMGLSGSLEGGAQFDSDFNRYQLRAFATPMTTNDNEPSMLSVPVESGRYTHITFSYRFTNSPARNGEIVLYKDGHVAASGDFAPTSILDTLTNANANFADKVLSIGGTHRVISNVTTDLYSDATGWGHLVSGVYVYKRVLHEGEILDMHNTGGLQPPLEDRDFTAVDITDSDLVAYYGFMGKGYIDIAKDHVHLLADLDLSTDFDSVTSTRRYFTVTGPFDRLGVRRNGITTGSADILALASTSGVTQPLLDSSSFTISCWHKPDKIVSDRVNTLFVWGSVGESTVSDARQTGGFWVRNVEGTTDSHLQLIVFNGGNAADQFTLDAPGHDPFQNYYHHVAFVYDDQTFGVALYEDGAQVASGNLSASLMPQLNRLAGSGFPITFLGGVEFGTIDAFGDTLGREQSIAEIAVMKRPLLVDQIRTLAYSGVQSVDDMLLTVHDPRLMSYWKCTDSIYNNAVIQDYARVFSGNGQMGHLTRAISNDRWTEILSNPADKEFHTDLFNLNVKSDLGITSGVYAVMGASQGISKNIFAGSAGDNRRTINTAFSDRFRITESDRNQRSPGLGHELIWSFEVTPSGNIPPTFDTADNMFNSLLLDYGQFPAPASTSTDRLFAFLTTFTTDDPALRLVWMSRDGTIATQNLVSGVVPFGSTSRILLHAKPVFPNIIGTAEGTSPVLFRLFVDGTLVGSQQMDSEDARFYSDTTREDWIFQVGGRSASDIFSTSVATQDGLGEIHLRNIFTMIGRFAEAEIQSLAANGITDTSTLGGYDDAERGKVVVHTDSDLQGLWRFTGRVGAGARLGIQDLSAAGNNLFPLAQQADEDGAFVSPSDNAFTNLRFVPGPYASGLVPTQASGITFAGNAPAADTSTIAPFAVSGTAFDSPADGFSVGFWLASREGNISFNTRRYVIGYGNSPTTTSNTAFVDASWQVWIDENDSLRLTLAHDGRLRLNDGVDTPYMTSCGAHRANKSDGVMELHKRGACDPGHKDSWNHFLWTFNRSEAMLKCFMNGVLVDRKPTPASGFHEPLNPDSRMLTMLVPPEGSAWKFSDTDTPFNSVLTDLTYLSRALTDEEVRFVAMSGIALGPSVPQGSGLIGGYFRAQDVGSGLLGGLIYSEVPVGSGQIGGFFHAIDTGSGLIGGYLVGFRVGSGIAGGFIQGSQIGSGQVGAFTIGAIQGQQNFDTAFVVGALGQADFDAAIQIKRHATADFDAQVVLFERELPPDVSIVYPAATVTGETPPFIVHLVGSGSAHQGKTIQTGRWYFGDMTPPVKVTPSGGNFYPVFHQYEGSGYYIARFEAIDSDGLRNSATRVIDATAGVPKTLITLSGVPLQGSAPLTVQFNQTIEALPPSVAISASLLDFGNGRTTTRINDPTYVYREPGVYVPIWCIRDTRGVIWCDTLEPGIDVL